MSISWRLSRRPAALAALAALALAVPAGCARAPAGTPDPVPRAGRSDAGYRVLVFSKTAGFRHDSIPAGIAAIRKLGAANGFTVDATEDAATFTPAGLARYQAVIFLSSTGDLLDAGQQAAFEGYLRSGGGFVGVHAAADAEYGWPFYGALLGAYFAGHPAVQRATVRVADPTGPGSAGLPAAWSRVDEWYNFRTDPGTGAHVLLTVDESSYHGGTMGADHPIAWCKRYAGGRSFYTGLGHTAASYADPAYLAHLLGGIRYAAGRLPARCG